MPTAAATAAAAAAADNALNSIFALEKKLMADINVFNTKYSCYLHQTNNNSDPAIRAKIQQNGNCSSTVDEAQVNSAKQAVITDIQQIQSAINTYNTTQGKTNNIQYETKYNQLITDYNALLDTRTDLDAKLAELYGTDDGITNYYTNQYRATMFSKIMLTILVTSLVYYTFMKIIKK
jgi:hypothetical protein